MENPTYTSNELAILERKVEDNVAVIEDYKKLESFLLSMGYTNIIKAKMIEFGILSYEEYLLGRKLNKGNTATITGTIIGVISALKRTLTNKI